MKASAAIVGVGQTEYSKRSGRTELSLACEAVSAALDDAGLSASDVDGIVRYDWDGVDELTLSTSIGFENLAWTSQGGDGGPAGNAVIGHAAAAIGSGAAGTVVAYRSLNGRSGHRIGGAGGERAGSGGEGAASDGGVAEVGGAEAFQAPWGMIAPVVQFGQFARRHMIEHGTTSEQFGAVAVAMRKHAGSNPAAIMRDPITLADHRESRMIADPLRLLDCCIESDGACAVVVTGAERARSCPRPPAWILGSAQATGPAGAEVVFRPDLDRSEAVACASSLYRRTGVRPSDIGAVMAYDHFTPFVIMALESYGFCEPGGGGELVEGGGIEHGGPLPVNTHGGNLSEAYLQGLSHVIEAVRQVRGEAVLQVDAELVLSCCATAGTSSALILAREG